MSTVVIKDYSLFSREDYLQLYNLIVRTRLLNKKIEYLKEVKRLFLGPALLSYGQEHVTCGAVFALEKAGIGENSWIGISHRDQGVFVWKNLEFELLLNHLMKATSWNRGRDGNMHLGSREHRIIPFGVSHMGLVVPQAVGAAEALRELEWPEISDPKLRPVVLAFFGDGAAQAGCVHEGMNWAGASNAEIDEETNNKLRGAPVIFILNNNELAISVEALSEHGKSHLARRADGYANMVGVDVFEHDPVSVYHAVRYAIKRAQRLDGSTLVVCHSYRLGGHSSSEDAKYMDANKLAVARAKDPLYVYECFLKNLKVKKGKKGEESLFSEEELRAIWVKSEKELDEIAERAIKEPDPKPYQVKAETLLFAPHAYTETKLPADAAKKKMICREAAVYALRNALRNDPKMVLFGEDVEDPKGGVLALTKGLSSEFGPRRIFNTPIAEEAILANAHGRALLGQKVVCEIQFAPFVSAGMTECGYAIPTAYYHNGAALSLVQIMPYGVVGPGGSGNEHSHSNEAWFYHLRGWKIIFPSDAYEVAGLLAAAIGDPNPVMVYLHIRANNDHEFVKEVHLDRYVIPIGKANVKRRGEDLTVVSYGAAAVQAALNTAAVIERKENVSLEVVDLRSIVPLDLETIIESIKKTRRVAILQEANVTGSVGESIVAKIVARSASFYLRHPYIEVLGADDRPVDSAYVLEWSRLPFQEVPANEIYPNEDPDLKRLFSERLYNTALTLVK